MQTASIRAQPGNAGIATRTIAGGEIVATGTAIDPVAVAALGDGQLLWIDLTDPARADLATLADACALHPLVMPAGDAPPRVPRVRAIAGMTQVVLHLPARVGEEIQTRELQILTAPRVVVTIHGAGGFDVDAMLAHWRATPPGWRHTSGALLYAATRTVLAAYQPVVDALDAELDALERATRDAGSGAAPDRLALRRLFEASERIGDVHSMAEPTRTVLQLLAQRGDWPAQGDERAWVNAVSDDLDLLTSRLDMMLDSASRVFDMVNSLISLRSADISNRLTIVATIFLPLAFLTSYFGQNFGTMNRMIEAGWAFALWGLVIPVVVLLVAIGLLRRAGAFDG